MAQTADVVYAKPRAPEEREPGKDVWWVKVGIAIWDKRKTVIRLDALPLNFDGKLQIFWGKQGDTDGP